MEDLIVEGRIRRQRRAGRTPGQAHFRSGDRIERRRQSRCACASAPAAPRGILARHEPAGATRHPRRSRSTAWPTRRAPPPAAPAAPRGRRQPGRRGWTSTPKDWPAAVHRPRGPAQPVSCTGAGVRAYEYAVARPWQCLGTRNAEGRRSRKAAREAPMDRRASGAAHPGSTDNGAAAKASTSAGTCVVITEANLARSESRVEAVGLTVSRLIRIRYGTVSLPHWLEARRSARGRPRRDADVVRDSRRLASRQAAGLAARRSASRRWRRRAPRSSAARAATTTTAAPAASSAPADRNQRPATPLRA